jgi:hypothetical protein
MCSLSLFTLALFFVAGARNFMLKIISVLQQVDKTIESFFDIRLSFNGATNQFVGNNENL